MNIDQSQCSMLLHFLVQFSYFHLKKGAIRLENSDRLSTCFGLSNCIGVPHMCDLCSDHHIFHWYLLRLTLSETFQEKLRELVNFFCGLSLELQVLKCHLVFGLVSVRRDMFFLELWCFFNSFPLSSNFFQLESKSKNYFIYYCIFRLLLALYDHCKRHYKWFGTIEFAWHVTIGLCKIESQPVQGYSISYGCNKFGLRYN